MLQYFNLGAMAMKFVRAITLASVSQSTPRSCNSSIVSILAVTKYACGCQFSKWIECVVMLYDVLLSLGEAERRFVIWRLRICSILILMHDTLLTFLLQQMIMVKIRIRNLRKIYIRQSDNPGNYATQVLRETREVCLSEHSIKDPGL